MHTPLFSFLLSFVRSIPTARLFAYLRYVSSTVVFLCGLSPVPGTQATYFVSCVSIMYPPPTPPNSPPAPGYGCCCLLLLLLVAAAAAPRVSMQGGPQQRGGESFARKRDRAKLLRQQMNDGLDSLHEVGPTFCHHVSDEAADPLPERR